MSTLKNSVVVSLLYSDNSTRNYTFENVADANLLAIKAAIVAVNKNDNDQYAAFYSTFISTDGAPVTRIDSAKIISTQEEVLFDE